MKRIIAVLLILALALSGCGATNDSETISHEQRPLEAVNIEIPEGGHDRVRYGMTLDELTSIVGDWNSETGDGKSYSYYLSNTQVLGGGVATLITYKFSKDGKLTGAKLAIMDFTRVGMDYFKLKEEWGKELNSTYKDITYEAKSSGSDGDIKDIASMPKAEFNQSLDEGAFFYIGTWKAGVYTLEATFMAYIALVLEDIGNK